MKALIAYYSATGVTANVAKKLAEVIGSDIYGIKPAVKNTPADLDWRDDFSRTSIEMKNKSFRPSIVIDELDVGPYNVVFVGFPIRRYVAPTIVTPFYKAKTFPPREWFYLQRREGVNLVQLLRNLKIAFQRLHLFRRAEF